MFSSIFGYPPESPVLHTFFLRIIFPNFQEFTSLKTNLGGSENFTENFL
jgi:hypothetical protein